MRSGSNCKNTLAVLIILRVDASSAVSGLGLPTPSWISAISSWMTENDWKETAQNWKKTMFQIVGCVRDAQKFNVELNIVEDIL